LDQFREQCLYSELRNTLRQFKKVYRPVAILIERAANGAALFSDLAIKWEHLLMPVDPDGRSKSARLRCHAKIILSRRIYLPADAAWRDEFVSEFVEFPRGRFSDQVDATIQFLDHADTLANPTEIPQEAPSVNMSYDTSGPTTFKYSTGGGRGVIAWAGSTENWCGDRR
jgi:predicted phage terminase large subunit-like protein